MDLEKFSLEELLLAAMKSEVEARDLYMNMAEQVDNAFLSDKLKFIAEEEKKHKQFLESVFKMNLQREVPELPEETPVPLGDIKVTSRTVAASDLFYQAMEAEKLASDFYGSIAERFEGDDETKRTMLYLSSMEMGHYHLLEIEKQQLDQQEEWEFEWEMMHAGP